MRTYCSCKLVDIQHGRDVYRGLQILYRRFDSDPRLHLLKPLFVMNKGFLLLTLRYAGALVCIFN